MAAKISGATIGLLALAGLTAAYFLSRPRAAYAQRRAPGVPRPGQPALPPPGIIQPTTDSELPPGFSPPYESSGRPASEFPMYSVAYLSVPLQGTDAVIYKLLKTGTEKDGHDFTDPYTWRGYGLNWEPTGSAYADVQTLNRAAPIARIVDRNGRLLWQPGTTPGLAYFDTEYIR